MLKVKIALITCVIAIWTTWAFAAVEYTPSPVTTVERHILDSLNVDQHIRVIGFITADSLKARRIMGDSLTVSKWISADSLWSRMIRGDSLRIKTWISADSLHSRAAGIDSTAWVTFLVGIKVSADTLDSYLNSTIGIKKSLIPYSNQLINSGSAARRWAIIFSDSLDARAERLVHLNTGSLETWLAQIDTLKKNHATGVIVIDPLFLSNTYMVADSVFSRTLRAWTTRTDTLDNGFGTEIRVLSDIVPNTNNTYNSGAAANRWLIIFGDSLDVRAIQAVYTRTDTLTVSRDADIAQTTKTDSLNARAIYSQKAYLDTVVVTTWVSGDSIYARSIKSIWSRSDSLGITGLATADSIYARAIQTQHINADTLDATIVPNLTVSGTLKSDSLNTRGLKAIHINMDSLNVAITATIAKLAADSLTTIVVAADTLRGRSDMDTRIVFAGGDSIKVTTSGTTRWFFGPSGNLKPIAHKTSDLGSSSLAIKDSYQSSAFADTVKGLGDTDTYIVMAGGDTVGVNLGGTRKITLWPNYAKFLGKIKTDSLTISSGINGYHSIALADLSPTFNMTDTLINKNRTSAVTASDSSSIKFSFSTLGQPKIDIKGITGNQIMKLDSLGNLGVQDGTSLSPSLNFLTDSDNGFYKSDANQITVMCGDDNRSLLFTAAGISTGRAIGGTSVTGARLISLPNSTTPVGGRAGYISLYADSTRADSKVHLWAMTSNGSVSNLTAIQTDSANGNMGVRKTTNLLARFTILGRAADTDTVLSCQDSSGAEKFSVKGNGNVSVGNAALAQSATAGFPYFPVMAGNPSGIPIYNAGRAAMVLDTTFATGRLYFNAGQDALGWRYAALVGGFQIPKEETGGLEIGDMVVGKIDRRLKDGALHFVMVKAPEGLAASAKVAELEGKIASLETRLLKLEPKPVVKKAVAKKTTVKKK